MKLCIRAHDLLVKGLEPITQELKRKDLDGVQMVCYKALEDVPYERGGISADKAERIRIAMEHSGMQIPLIGAYFNPVHSDREKAQRCFDIFAEYLNVATTMGCNVVGSETGSFNDDHWTYHPMNRTEQGLDMVVETFARLADIAAQNGVNIAMEGSSGHVCYDVATLDRAIRRINKPNVQVIFDLFNYLDKDNQADYMKILQEGLETFKGNILLFHMKDWDIVPGGEPRQVPFGRGMMDKEAVIGAIKAYDPNAVLVLEGTVGEDITAAVQTIRTIWERV